MALRDWIGTTATATPATPATHAPSRAPTVARVATVAVATTPDRKPTAAAEIGAVVDYTLLDLRAFDKLIDEYVALAFRDPGERNTKRVELLALRRNMSPSRVKAELAEFRAMVDELRAQAARPSRTARLRS